MRDSVDSDSTYTAARNKMVKDQLVWRGIQDEKVLEAMRTVPRHHFVPPEYTHMAYDDCPLPIGQGQTISQPYIVALMTELLGLRGDENALEVGAGSGRQVHTIERHPELANQARARLVTLGLANVQVHTGDGSLGLPAFAPYQAILVTAAAPHTPPPLLEQLDEGGRLVLPVGSRGVQTLEIYIRQGGKTQRRSHIPVAFVPLRGEHGWREDRWDRD
jgi:protein-L-isoaspartate(D-aspartate) O-methyltransferase